MGKFKTISSLEDILRKGYKKECFTIIDIGHWHNVYKYKPWISHKNDKAIKIIIKKQIVLWKTIGNRRWRVWVRVRVRLILFYSELGTHWPVM